MSLSRFDQWKLDNGIKFVGDKVVDAEHWLRTCLDQAISGDTDTSSQVAMYENDDGQFGAEVQITIYVDDADPAEVGRVLCELGRKLR